jgi:hypothetical protein
VPIALRLSVEGGLRPELTTPPTSTRHTSTSCLRLKSAGAAHRTGRLFRLSVRSFFLSPFADQQPAHSYHVALHRTAWSPCPTHWNSENRNHNYESHSTSTTDLSVKNTEQKLSTHVRVSRISRRAADVRCNRSPAAPHVKSDVHARGDGTLHQSSPQHRSTLAQLFDLEK